MFNISVCIDMVGRYYLTENNENLTAHEHIVLDGYIIASKITKNNRPNQELNCIRKITSPWFYPQTNLSGLSYTSSEAKLSLANYMYSRPISINYIIYFKKDSSTCIIMYL